MACDECLADDVLRIPVIGERAFLKPIEIGDLAGADQARPVFWEGIEDQPGFQEADQAQPVFWEGIEDQPGFQEADQAQPVFQMAAQAQPVFWEGIEDQPGFQEAAQALPVFREADQASFPDAYVLASAPPPSASSTTYCCIGKITLNAKSESSDSPQAADGVDNSKYRFKCRDIVRDYLRDERPPRDPTEVQKVLSKEDMARLSPAQAETYARGCYKPVGSDGKTLLAPRFLYEAFCKVKYKGKCNCRVFQYITPREGCNGVLLRELQRAFCSRKKRLARYLDKLKTTDSDKYRDELERATAPGPKDNPDVNPGGGIGIDKRYQDYIHKWYKCCGENESESDTYYMSFVDAPGGYSTEAMGILDFEIVFISSYGQNVCKYHSCRIMFRLYINMKNQGDTKPTPDFMRYELLDQSAPCVTTKESGIDPG